MFSGRSPADLTPTPYAVALEQLRAAGVTLIDLTVSNPTAAGFRYPASLLAPLGNAAGLQYDPHPLGLFAARQAVAEDYARRGVAVGPEHVALTASTSEAYSVLFKLLCDPGDEVLVPAPSYPLFEHLARLDSVRPVPYALEYHGRWSVDVEGVRRAATGRTRALVVVSPNNPTGSFVSAAELGALAALCADRGLVLIGDEVFADYGFGDAAGPSVVSQEQARAFALGGLSKSAALPQVKLGWIAMADSSPVIDQTLARLELVLDTYLSVSTPVQYAARELIAAGSALRHQIRHRTAANLATLRAMVAEATVVDVLNVEGGWSAVLRVPARQTEETLALELLQHDHVVVHPGYFFDFPHEAFLIVSLLPPPEEFALGVRRVIERAR
jgi:alanine-synthesizing transaminase